MASRPSPHRQFEKTFPTPLIGDVIFRERQVYQTRNLPEYGTPHPNTAKWPNHIFVYAREREEPDAQDVFDCFYAAVRETQDLYNFSHAEADIGGTKFDAVTRTYVTLRDEFDPETPLMGSTMPDSPEGKFSGVYVLAERKQTRIGEQVLDSMFVAEQRTYVKKVTLTSLDFDQVFGGTLRTTQTLRYRGEQIPGTGSPLKTIEQLVETDISPPYWGLQSNGVAREVTQLTDNWFVVTERQVVPTFMVGEEGGRTYPTTVDFYWPAVLSNIQVQPWERRDGGVQRYMIPEYVREAYRGPTPATVTERFYAEAPTVDPPQVMLPLPINIQSPYFGVNVGPTLHVEYNLDFTNGTEDPEFVFTVASYDIPATEPTDWPSSLLASDEVKPYRGGFLRTTIVLGQPLYTT